MLEPRFIKIHQLALILNETKICAKEVYGIKKIYVTKLIFLADVIAFMNI